MYVNASLKLPASFATLRVPDRLGAQAVITGTLGVEKTMPTRIILADDHALVRQASGPCSSAKACWYREASDGREAISHAEKLSPDVVIMDIGMPTLNGMEAARELAKCCPKVKPFF